MGRRKVTPDADVLTATMRVVNRVGPGRLTLADVAAEAGLAPATLLQRFGSKRGLIDAVIGYLHRRRENILEVEHVNELPAIDAIAHFSDCFLRELSGGYGGRAYVMLLAASVADASSMREAFAASSDRVGAWLESVIRRGQAEKTIRPDIDPRTSALMIGSMVLGISMQWLVDPATDLEPIRKSTIAAVRQSLSLQDGRSR